MRYHVLANLLPFLVSAQTSYPECDPPLSQLRPEWTLDGIHYSTTAGQADITFALSSNFRKSIIAECKASSAGPFDGEDWFDCEFSEDAAPQDGARFRFNSETSTVEVDQTWTCVNTDGNPTVTRFTALGSESVELECESPAPEETECTAGSLSFEPSELTAVA